MTEPLRLVIDTDTASDDAVALVLAVASGRACVEAVTTVAGNVPLPLTVRNALYTLELAGARDVPVHAGCERPLVRPLSTAQTVHGEDGMGDVGLPEPTGRARQEHAVDALLELATRSGGELTLVTLGPLTNIAACLARRRDFLTSFRHVYSMAGAPDAVGNVSATAEFNVWADPEAAAMVVDAAVPEQVTWIGWDVSRKDAVLSPQHQQDLRAVDTPLATFTNDVNRTVQEFCHAVTGLEGYDLPDPIAMAAALAPELVLERETAQVRIALGDEARGQMLVDRRADVANPNLSLVRRMDGAGFRRLLLATCRDPREPLQPGTLRSDRATRSAP